MMIMICFWNRKANFTSIILNVITKYTEKIYEVQCSIYRA